ncbi:MAG: hypothetical protein JXA06_05615 [Bacteroidetes bacterium]|nr:hypothetical protein [Bacteroidota bacterium]
MSGLEVEINGSKVRADLNDDGWIVCQCEVGALAVPGLIQGKDIPDSAHIFVHGREERSSHDSKGKQWLDQSLTVQSLQIKSTVRVRVLHSLSALPKPGYRPRASARQLQRFISSKMRAAEHLLEKSVKHGLPPEPDFSRLFALEPAGICLRMVSDPILHVFAGAPKGVVIASIEFRRSGALETLSVEVRGSSPSHPDSLYYWARGPIYTDEITLAIEKGGEPDPVRILPCDPYLRKRYEQKLYDVLANELK